MVIPLDMLLYTLSKFRLVPYPDVLERLLMYVMIGR
jgi:hypothetical protein